MARYEQLPIYKQTMDVAVHFEKIVADFPLSLAGRHSRRLLDAGFGIAYIGERDNPFGGIHLRVPFWRRVRVQN